MILSLNIYLGLKRQKDNFKRSMLHRSGLYKFEASPKTKSLDGAVHAIQARELMKNFIINIYIMMLIT